MKKLLVLVIVVILGFGYYGHQQVEKINSRLDRLENKFGGIAKIECTEKDTIESVKKSVVRIIGGESEGSGFSINNDGAILTNFHVIEFEPSPKVVFPDQTFETAEIKLADKDADIALLHVKKRIPALSWGNPQNLDPSEELLAVGFPFGGELNGEATVNKGGLAGRRHDKDTLVDYIQTDTTLNPGVSGGPMVDICGKVMGMNTAGTSGLGLAISSDTLMEKWIDLLSVDDPLKDVKKFDFNPQRSEIDAVEAFYNYLKARRLEEAYKLLSTNFTQQTFDEWEKGYNNSMDTSLIKIESDPKLKNRINIKISSKDIVEDEIVYKYYEGYWDVKKEDGLFSLWAANITQVHEPSFLWFYD